jgi:hypothetical protein
MIVLMHLTFTEHKIIAGQAQVFIAKKDMNTYDIHILMILTEDPADSTKIKTYTHYFY